MVYRKTHMAARVLFVLAILVTSYGCVQAGPPVLEQPEATPEPEPTVAGEDATVSCSEFYGPQDAQAFFDTEATAAEKLNLNPDGDEWACNEEDVTFKPEPTQMTSAPELTGLQPTPMFYEWRCRADTYIRDQGMSEAEAEAFSREFGTRIVEDNDAGEDKDANDVLDDMGVPSYALEC